MWRRFWFRTHIERDDALAYAPDVLLANWIPPLQESEAAHAGVVQAPAEGEAGDFLLRVYAYQEC